MGLHREAAYQPGHERHFGRRRWLDGAFEIVAVEVNNGGAVRGPAQSDVVAFPHADGLVTLRQPTILDLKFEPARRGSVSLSSRPSGRGGVSNRAQHQTKGMPPRSTFRVPIHAAYPGIQFVRIMILFF